MTESNTVLKSRALRFARETRKGPPALPIKNVAHPGGNITTNNKNQCLQKLIERKMANGQKLTTEQVRALGENVPIRFASGSSGLTLMSLSLQKPQASHSNEA